MNAIISLCHFCEVHGPRIVYSTQPFRPQEPKEISQEDADGGIPYQKSSSVSSSDQLYLSSSTLSNSKVVCEGCSSAQTDFVSHDVEAKVSYVSTRHINNPEVFTRIRQACIRSLSCEVCPGREGPIFFGDEQCGQVLSYTFYIRDTQARGLNRWYSILVIMMDKIYLLNSWPFLVKNIQLIIENLQNKGWSNFRLDFRAGKFFYWHPWYPRRSRFKNMLLRADLFAIHNLLRSKHFLEAQKVFDMEEAKCPQRPYRMQSVVDPTNFIKQRGGGNKTTRSLQELTADKNIFCMLHTAFIWILRICGNKTKETLLEGPPTEDSIIDVEKQEETEEGFVMIHTRKVVDEDLETGEPTNLASDDGIDKSAANTCGDIKCDNSQSGVDGQVGHEGPCVNNLRHLRKCLGSTNFQILAHHVVIGNQIIIRGCEQSLVNSVIHLLKGFLPKGSSNLPHLFLALSLDTDVSSHQPPVPKNHITLDIISKEVISLDSLCSGSGEDFLDSSDFREGVDEDEEADEVSPNYRFQISSPITLPSRVPTVLSRMVLTLCNRNLSQEVVESCFTCLKEEWMNKVKVHYTFTRSAVKRSEDEMKKLLQMLGAREEDRPLLEFWMTGLSVQYRTHVMSTSSHR